MFRLSVARVIVVALPLVTVPAAGSAQGVEVLGTRALGMGGAFVAVADDVSAVYWNPAGLASGPYFGASLEFTDLQQPRTDARLEDAAPAGGHSWLVGVGTLPVGVSYYRVGAAGRDPDAPVPGIAGGVAIAKSETHQVGFTLLQTLVDGVTVAATVKYLRWEAATGVVVAETTSEVREAAEDLDGASGNAADMDIGVHATAGLWRFGVVARNVFEPSLDAGIVLGRQVRLGMAVAPAEGWIVAADADLLEAESAIGPFRRASVGLERWLPGERVAFRGGLRASTLGPARPVGTAGASLALRSGLYLDGFLAAGGGDAERAFGLALRAAF